MSNANLGTAALAWICLAATCLAQTSPVDRTTNSLSRAVPAQTLEFQLKPTAIAPAGCVGSARLEGRVLLVHLSQLAPGRYELQAGLKPEGASVKIGLITIVDPTASPSRQATDNKKEASASPESVSVNTDVSVTLPRDLVAHDIESIRVLGPGGNAVLDSHPKQG